MCVDRHVTKYTKDAQKKPRELVLSQHAPNCCQHEPFTFIPTTQHKHRDGNNKTNKGKRKKSWDSSNLPNCYQPSHFAFVLTTTWVRWRWQDRWIDRQKQKHTNRGKERGAEKVHAFPIIVKLLVMAMHFVFVVAHKQTHPKQCHFWTFLACPNAINSRSSNTFGSDGEMTIQQNTLH